VSLNVRVMRGVLFFVDVLIIRFSTLFESEKIMKLALKQYKYIVLIECADR
jgi:hypothetical protein